MVKLLQLLRALRPDLAVGLLAWFGVDVMAHPHRLIAVVGDPRLTHPMAFEIGTGIAFVACAFLTLRWVVRLVKVSRQLSWDPALRATQGTVMVEFALVLPWVLLLIGTVIQIALIAQAAVVVRYAAFVAARSAMVSFEADVRPDLTASGGQGLLAALQLPPLHEWVDAERPERAACMVLAALSPRANGPDPEGRQMERLLEAQGAAWQHGGYSRRMAYARAATTLTTIRSRQGGGLQGYGEALHDSYPPLIPLPEHVVQPSRQKDNPDEIGYLLPEPPPVASMIPDEIPIDISIPIPEPFDTVVPPISFSFSIPLPRSVIDPLAAKFDVGINALRSGSAVALRQYARSQANIDPLSPKEVEINLVYHFKLAIPSLLQLAPGVTDDAPSGFPPGSGRFFRLMHEHYFTVRLQSTGGRRTLLGMFPWAPDILGGFKLVPNTPFYWRWREKAEEEEEDEEDEEEKKKKESEEEKDAKKKVKEAEDKKKKAEEEEEKNKKKEAKEKKEEEDGG